MQWKPLSVRADEAADAQWRAGPEAAERLVPLRAAGQRAPSAGRAGAVGVSVFVPLLQRAINRRTGERIETLRSVGGNIVEVQLSDAQAANAQEGQIEHVFTLDMGFDWIAKGGVQPGLAVPPNP